MGQEDLYRINCNISKAILEIKKIIGNKILGISTHNRVEVEVANLLDIDYIGLGAYRNTSTKKSVKVRGDDLINIAKLSKHSVALIGGVRLNDDFTKYSQIEYKVIGSDLIKKFKEIN